MSKAGFRTKCKMLKKEYMKIIKDKYEDGIIFSEILIYKYALKGIILTGNNKY